MCFLLSACFTMNLMAATGFRQVGGFPLRTRLVISKCCIMSVNPKRIRISLYSCGSDALRSTWNELHSGHEATLGFINNQLWTFCEIWMTEKCCSTTSLTLPVSSVNVSFLFSHNNLLMKSISGANAGHKALCSLRAICKLISGAMTQLRLGAERLKCAEVVLWSHRRRELDSLIL